MTEHRNKRRRTAAGLDILILRDIIAEGERERDSERRYACVAPHTTGARVARPGGSQRQSRLWLETKPLQSHWPSSSNSRFPSYFAAFRAFHCIWVNTTRSSSNMSIAVPAGFHALPLPITQLSLAAVLKCGQSFRWNIFPLHVPGHAPAHHDHPTHEYRLCLRDRVVCLRQSRDALFYRSVFPPFVSGDQGQGEAETLSWLRDSFQLDVDLVDLDRKWSTADPIFNRIQDRFEGIRMFRQDPFENLIS